MTDIDRREFLKFSGLAATLTALAACRPLIQDPLSNTDVIDPTLNPPAFDEDWLLHASLHRITFAPTSEDIEYARQIGIDNYIDEQLDPQSIDDAQLDPMLANFSTLTAHPTELFRIEPAGLPVVELVAATILRAVYSKRQLFELMVDFWTNHFNIYIASAPERFFKPTDDREVIRHNALGNFGDMLFASAKSPAMLTYLDNADSTKDRPNENYARELLELHTLGVDGGYTQFDVEEVARAFTGWTIVAPRNNRLLGKRGEFIFAPTHHDEGEKLVLGYTLPAGQGLRDGEQILEILIDHPSTAKYIASKLVQRFVSDNPPSPLVIAAAKTFTQSRGDIAKVMGTILHSEEFKLSLGQKMKRPFELLVSTLRVTNAQVEPTRFFDFHMSSMGQPLFRWETPDGYPDDAQAWASTSGMMARWNYVMQTAIGSGSPRNPIKIDWPNLLDQVDSNGQALDTLSEKFVGQILPDEARQIILDFVGNLYSDDTLPAITALIMASPYFQFR